MRSRQSTTSRSVYDIITDRVIGLLEQGVAPWRRPWGGRFRFPRNLVSGKDYRGVNVFLLSMAGYSSPHWLTFKQAKALGGHVRKGEKSMPVVFWSMVETTDKETGQPKEIPVLRYYSAFNVAQCELPQERIPSDDEKRQPFKPITACEHVVSEMPQRPDIKHGFDKACYVPALDLVRMPEPSAFDAPEGYYGTLFHELGHSTAHASRLNRPAITGAAPFGSDDYGREELVAEMTATFLCGHTGIETVTLENTAAYISGWLRIIRQDARLVVTAAAQAQKAADFILGRSWERAET